jgi:hypothetical protein
MDLTQTSRWRRLAGWAGALFCFLAALALLDGVIGQFRESASVIKLLPGMTAEINGPLSEKVRGVEELTYLSDSDDLKLSLAEVHKGYFLGGELWRGQITAAPGIPPGEYHLTVASRRSATPRPLPAFRILVFADPLSLQRSSKSVVRRETGLSPLGMAAACLPGILLTFGAVFLLSQKQERLLAQKGRAEIYRVIRGDGSFEIYFGLGTAHGVQPGLELSVYDDQGKLVGLARVASSTPGEGVAVMIADREIRPGFMVASRA